ncbi:MAG TPA: RDD family protein, partial [Actinomycetota bacterium]|nr:RDD family protein [Actinomycetota bacterium]
EPPPAAAGPPREALAGFWRRLAAAFLDWILIGVVTGAIGQLFGVDVPSPPSADGDVYLQPAPGPFILVELAYFTWFHATSAGQSIGNRILGIRVLDAATGRSLPYARAFVRALVSNLSALALFLGYFWMLWEPRKRTWHDIVADSLVVRSSFYPPGEFARPAR